MPTPKLPDLSYRIVRRRIADPSAPDSPIVIEAHVINPTTDTVYGDPIFVTFSSAGAEKMADADLQAAVMGAIEEAAAARVASMHPDTARAKLDTLAALDDITGVDMDLAPARIEAARDALRNPPPGDTPPLD